MTESLKYFYRIRQKLSRFSHEIALTSPAGMVDLSKWAENIVRNLLNIAWKCDFINLNKEHESFPVLDLGDEAKGIGVQVKTSCDTNTVKNILSAAVERQLHKRFPRIVIFILAKKEKSYRISIPPDQLLFDPNKDIIDMGGFLRELQYAELPVLKAVSDYLDTEFPEQKKKRFKPLLAISLALLTMATAFLVWKWFPVEKDEQLLAPKTNALRMVILPFLHDNNVHIQTVLASALQNLVRADSMDIEVKTADVGYTVPLADSVAIALMRRDNADMLIWGEYSQSNQRDFYQLHYRIAKWPGLTSPETGYKPFVIENVSAGHIEGNLSCIVRYVNGLILYQSISRVPVGVSPDHPRYQKEFNNVGKSIVVFDSLLYDSECSARLGDSLHLYLANAHQFLEHNDSAIVHYRQYLQRNDRDDNALNSLSYLYKEQGDSAAALRALNRAIALTGPDSRYLFNKGVYYFYNGDYDSASAIFSRVKSRSEYAQSLLYHRAAAYYYRQKTDSALQTIDKAIAMDSTAENLFLAGKILSSQGKLNQAYYAFQAAVPRSADPLPAQKAVLESLIMQLCNPESINLANGLVLTFPADYSIYQLRAMASYNAKQYDPALVDLSYAMHLDSMDNKLDPTLYYNRSYVYLAKKNAIQFRSDSLKYAQIAKRPENLARYEIGFSLDSMYVTSTTLTRFPYRRLAEP